MINKQETEWSEPYLRTDLPAKEHDRLVAELRADPHLLGKLLQLKSPEEENLSAALLFDDPNVPNQDALDDNIRRYLLRDPTFTDEEIGELEELMLEDERYFERVMLVEDELIEDSLRGALSPNETERFNNYFLVTPERREKLAFVEAVASTYVEKKAKGVGALVAEPTKAEQSETTSTSWLDSLRAFFHSQSLFAGVAAASVLLFVAVGALWLISRQAKRSDSLIATAPKNDSMQDEKQQRVLNKVAKLTPEEVKQAANRIFSANTSETGNVSRATTPTGTNAVLSQPTRLPQNDQSEKKNENAAPVKPTPTAEPTVTVSRSVVFALSMGVSRSGGGGVEKKIEPGVKVVELRLPLDVEREYDDFRVVVQDSDGNEVARREKLKATKKGKLPFVTTAISAKPFKPDDYTVILSGGTKGVYQEEARYSFRVIK